MVNGTRVSALMAEEKVAKCKQIIWSRGHTFSEEVEYSLASWNDNRQHS